MAPSIFETDLISKSRNPCTATGSKGSQPHRVDQCDTILFDPFGHTDGGVRDKTALVAFETRLLEWCDIQRGKCEGLWGGANDKQGDSIWVLI